MNKEILGKIDKAIEECNCTPRYIVLSTEEYRKLLTKVLYFQPISYRGGIILINPTASVGIDVV